MEITRRTECQGTNGLQFSSIVGTFIGMDVLPKDNVEMSSKIGFGTFNDGKWGKNLQNPMPPNESVKIESYSDHQLPDHTLKTSISICANMA